ncbi:MAG: GNAT family N-acetyltransferase [bacterium]|nr:GNAT family N-acetyltransferase [bacterium]
MIGIHQLVDISFSGEINNLLKELSPNAEPITEHDLKRCLENHFFFLFIATDSDKEYPKDLVGMATVFFTWKCSGWLAEVHDIVVTPTYRGRHIGDMLMKKLLEVAKAFAEQEAKKITVSLTSKPHRIAANLMYQQHGFELVAQAVGKNGTNLYKLVMEPR